MVQRRGIALARSVQVAMWVKVDIAMTFYRKPVSTKFVSFVPSSLASRHFRNPLFCILVLLLSHWILAFVTLHYVFSFSLTTTWDVRIGCNPTSCILVLVTTTRDVRVG